MTIAFFQFNCRKGIFIYFFKKYENKLNYNCILLTLYLTKLAES